MALENIEAIFPLSPVQEATLLRGEDAGSARGHLTCDIKGELNAAAFESACRKVVEAHAILRAAFVWKRVERPLQAVRKQVEIAVESFDLRDLSPDSRRERIEAFISDERNRIDPSAPPLLRFALFRSGANEHRFVCLYHRLALDERSAQAVLSDILTAYGQASNGASARLPERRPFRDYVAWLKRQDQSEAEAFWRAMLGGAAPALHSLHLCAERKVVADGGEAAFAEKRISLSEATIEALRSMAAANRLSLSAIVNGAWAILLDRYSGEQDLVFGVTLSGPPDELGGATMIGPFENTLPLRVRVPEDEPVIAWLKSLEEQLRQLRRFKHNSLEQVRQWAGLGEERQLFDTAVVDAGAAIEPSPEPLEHLRVDNLRVANLLAPSASAVSLLLDGALEGEPVLKLAYDAARFDGDAIDRMLGHLRNLLESIASAPEQRVARLCVLSEEERNRLLFDWNGEGRDYDASATVSRLFEAQARKDPNAVALRCGGKQLTYLEVNKRANQLAHHLKRMGVGPEVMVGICMEPSPEMVISMLGVLKAGGAFLPLDPAYPLDRLTYMIEDAQVVVLLTQERLIEGLPVFWAQVVCVDSDWESIAGLSDEDPQEQAASDNLAYIIYTSGSTGRPKGVMVSHKGVGNLAQAQGAAFGVARGSRVLQFASLSFDASISEIFVTLLEGATLVVSAREDIQPGPALIRLLRDEEVSVITLPPSVLAAMDYEELPALKTLVAAGEALSAEIVAKWARGRRLINAYGPTEATVCATLTECAADGASPTIGRPIQNAQVFILDKRMDPVPVGVAGEIYIGGVGLARGYLKQPALTAERFVPDPFSGMAGARLYRTGDLARYRDGGEIDYIGRTDHQVKVRGFRIEPGEIQSAIAAHSAVKDCVVIARSHADGEKRLVAYIIEDQQGALTVAEVRNYLRERLPDYMIPSRFVVLEKFPLTVSGKVDRSALPEPDRALADMKDKYEGPRNEIEEKLVRIWSELLKVDSIGIYDNFFDLGGHSLLATQLVSRVQESFDVELPVRALFNAPTVALFAAEIERSSAAAVAQTGPAIHALPRGNESLEQLLARLDQMSDEEARALLQNRNLLAGRRNGNE